MMETMTLASGLSDGLYDVPSGHAQSHGYHYAAPLWHSTREDRTCQLSVHPTMTSLENRTPGHTQGHRISPEKNEIELPEISDWIEDARDTKEFEKPSSEQTSQKQSQVASTLKWLTENYERAEGVCLPRCVLYTHYLDFCKKMKFTPAGAATFGKIIRQKFPKLTTRRLGTRGQSKYHYYGIGIKESSIYYHSVYSGKGLTRFSGIKIKTEGSNRKYSLSSKTGTLLPEFPDANNLILPENITREKMQTFIMMYRTHCQRILDTVISANFEEVQNFLLHFWQGMPEHLIHLLDADMIVDIVGLCDSILYKVLVDVLIPSTIQDLPDSLGSEIKLFVKRLPHWLDNALDNIPEGLRQKKLEVVKGFIQSIVRQTSFVHLAQTARTALLNHDVVNQIIDDVTDINFTEICCRAGFIEPSTASTFKDDIMEFYEEFQSLLSKQAPIEAFTEWMDTIIDKCVLQPKKDNGKKFRERASKFLLQWAIFGSLFMRDLTLRSAASFGVFHLVHMMFDEYVFLVMETQQDQAKEDILQRNVQRHMKNAEEINMNAKVRTPSTKSHHNRHNKKEKMNEDHFDATDEGEPSTAADENQPDVPEVYTPSNITAFSRPTPNNRESSHFSITDDTCRSNVAHASLPLSPLKPYPSINTGPYDRPTYLPQYGIHGSYGDYVNGASSLATTRIASFSDTHAQAFGSVPFNNNVQQPMSSYWTDGRTHAAIHDTYPYSYNKFPSTYDTYNKSSFIPSGHYQDALNRSRFESSRSYHYRPTHDNLQAVASHLSMGGYSGNYMDIAQPGSQYGRQDTMIYQDDIYTGGLPPTFPTVGKSYLTAPFR
ncbi:DNA-binding protein RFX6-like [Mizuhopecten yessoensis]|nr:DNA-binding protein RFX6-like [Mizuhopecten yessoensis]